MLTPESVEFNAEWTEDQPKTVAGVDNTVTWNRKKGKDGVVPEPYVQHWVAKSDTQWNFEYTHGEFNAYIKHLSATWKFDEIDGQPDKCLLTVTYWAHAQEGS